MRFIHRLISIIFAVVAAQSLRAQVSIQVTPSQAARLQVPQAAVVADDSSVTATAEFDPTNAQIGQTVFYRVAIDGAVEKDVAWPGAPISPAQLKFGPVSHGQLMQVIANKFRPLTAFLYQVQATATGNFTVPNFEVMIDGKRVQIPAATLNVGNSVSETPPRCLTLQVSDTNIYVGQPLRASVVLPASQDNQIDALREVQFNGNGFMNDLTTTKQAVEMVGVDGRATPAFVYEITLTPIEAGSSALSAQGFTAGREFSGPVIINGHVVISGGPPHYVFLASSPVQVNVHPLPTEGQPADFGGSIGSFTLGPPQLSTNRIQQSEPVRLTVSVHSNGTLNHLVPPVPPTVNDWEIIPDNPPGFSFTLIPLTGSTRQTPAIPFSCFDPASGRYVDLTIPSLPVTVISTGLPTEMPAEAGTTPGSPLKLGGLASSPGGSVASLAPPQLRGWFVVFQIIPILGILGLWQWDRRRRFLEAHPEIVRRREARRLLRREKRLLLGAARRGDEAAIVRHAANAMKIASSPHYAAHPQALVCGDILNHLHDTDRNGAIGETVRKIFAAADARFASAPNGAANWPALTSDVSTVLLKLEEQL
ncbi:MAG TPA: BatD family protein [Verrucomicrobiae bacterium]|jgi:hypothetical protein|nr:BatD family protein [Verrucomicrobiae bacterium]